MFLFRFLFRLFRNDDPVIIIPFGGYANDLRMYAQARVLEDEDIRHTEEDSIIKNLWNTFKRFESDEKAGAHVNVLWDNNIKTLTSDEEGYIYLDEAHGLVLNNPQTTWIPVTYQLIEQGTVIYQSVSDLMKPGRNVEYGIISDMDDTVLETGVDSLLKWRLLVNSFMKHSHKRMPKEGAQPFYHRLQNGRSGHNTNPFFYLSNSPWNLYGYLESFLKKQDFPRGTLLLKDIDIRPIRKRSLTEGNKYKKIRHILETFPGLPFILIGDAGERDTEIYITIARTFPDRILTIYIRAVKRKSNLKKVEELIKQHADLDIILVTESEQAIRHARSKGYIVENSQSG